MFRGQILVKVLDEEVLNPRKTHHSNLFKFLYLDNVRIFPNNLELYRFIRFNRFWCNQNSELEYWLLSLFVVNLNRSPRICCTVYSVSAMHAVFYVSSSADTNSGNCNVDTHDVSTSNMCWEENKRLSHHLEFKLFSHWFDSQFDLCFLLTETSRPWWQRSYCHSGDWHRHQPGCQGYIWETERD